MNKKMIEIRGKQISESTIVEALKAHCGFEEFDESKAPVFSKTGTRLIVKMTNQVKKYFADYSKNVPTGQYCSFEPDGFFGAINLGKTWNEAKNFYSNNETPKSLFPDDYPDPKI